MRSFVQRRSLDPSNDIVAVLLCSAPAHRRNARWPSGIFIYTGGVSGSPGRNTIRIVRHGVAWPTRPRSGTQIEMMLRAVLFFLCQSSGAVQTPVFGGKDFAHLTCAALRDDYSPQTPVRSRTETTSSATRHTSGSVDEVSIEEVDARVDHRIEERMLHDRDRAEGAVLQKRRCPCREGALVLMAGTLQEMRGDRPRSCAGLYFAVGRGLPGRGAGRTWRPGRMTCVAVRARHPSNRRRRTSFPDGIRSGASECRSPRRNTL